MPLKAFFSTFPSQRPHRPLWSHSGILLALLGLLVASFFLSSCGNASQVWSKAFGNRKLPATLSLVYDDDLTQGTNSAWANDSFTLASACTFSNGDYTVSADGDSIPSTDSAGDLTTSQTVAVGCPRKTEEGSTSHFYAFQLTIKDIGVGYAGLLFNNVDAFVVVYNTYGFYNTITGTSNTLPSATVSGTLPSAVTFPLHIGLIYDGKCHYYINGQEVKAGTFQQSCPGDFGAAVVGAGAMTDVTEATFWKFF